MQQPNADIPNHLGIILDGNRRWAKQQGLASIEGHKAGFETFRLIADAAVERGVKNLSIFAFSTENWNRSKEEVSFLLKFVQFVLKKYLNELNSKGVRFIWLGSPDGLDEKVVKTLKNAQAVSATNTKATLCLCFNYGGQQEIVDAANKCVASGQALTLDSLQSQMYGGDDVPPVDMIIRTSGEQRISNFMLWRAAYSELYFSDVMWPDFKVSDLDLALQEFKKRQRRYGA